MAVKAPGSKIEAFMQQEDVKEDEEEKSDSEQEEEESGCWAREIIIETLSKDQGWSTAVSHHPELYGELPTFELLEAL
jgi:chorismate-pyruvate lyase